jgi:CheY-like chemotaxis protein
VAHTLLLADDSVTIQRVVELTFAGEDVRVVSVSDGDQAIARLETNPPDIVLADIGMPGKNGYEVAAYIRRTPSLAQIPVVLLAGASEQVDRARIDELKCDGVLAKPFEPQQVIGRVRELLSRSRGNGNSQAEIAPVDGNSQPEDQTVKEENALHAADLDGYFDRLDAAFASLSPSKDGSAAPPLDLPLSYGSPQAQFGRPLVMPAAEPAPPDIPVEAVSTPTSNQPASMSAVSTMTPPGATASPNGAAPPTTVPVEPTAGVTADPATASLPPLAAAFAAILAAERNAPDSAAASWPVNITMNAAVTDELVERVSRRVLEQLSERSDEIIRQQVAEIVANVAERLVREEIARLKSNLK